MKFVVELEKIERSEMTFTAQDREEAEQLYWQVQHGDMEIEKLPGYKKTNKGTRHIYTQRW